MVDQSSLQPFARPADQLTIRRVGVDDWAGVRYVHATAFRVLAAGECEAGEIDAFAGYVRSQDYANRLAAENLHAGWLDGELVGTSGWIPADDSGALARITSVFVRPLLTRIGIGSRLAMDAEARARAAGFERFSTRAMLNSVGFFERLGYEVTSYGVHAISPAYGMPVTYMRKRANDAATEVNKGVSGASVPDGTADLEPQALSPRALVTPRGR